MIIKVFTRILIFSVMVTVVVTNYRVTILEQKVKSVYSSLANFEAERVAARRQLQKETAPAIDKLQELSKGYNKFPNWPGQ